eukprot:273083_1
MSQSLILISYIIQINIGQNNCVFEDAGGSGKILDLTSIADQTISQINQHPFNYTFTPCSNNLQCFEPNSITHGMMLQINPDEIRNTTGKPYCAVLAQWDNGTIQPTFDHDERAWFWTYNNGDSYGCRNTETNTTFNRSLSLQIYCGENLRSNEIKIEYVGETSLLCSYILILQSKLACVNEGKPHKSNLSTGSIVIVIFTVFVCMYFIVGCVMTNCKKAPHQDFWEKFPKYVFVGCQVSKSKVCRLFGCKC